MDEDDSQEENLERTPTGQKQRNTRSCRKNANRNDSRDKSKKSSEPTKARKRKTASSEDDPSFSDVEEEEDLSGQHKKVILPCSLCRKSIFSLFHCFINVSFMFILFV